jgi:hypothetical protein
MKPKRRTALEWGEHCRREAAARNPPTPRMVALLRKFRLYRDGLSFDQARGIIDRLAANGWRIGV